MTVPATTRKAGPYAGNGVTTQFPFSFKVFDAAGIQPVLTDVNGTATNLVLNSDYSVLLNSDQDANPGGTVTYPILVGPVPLPVGSTLTVIGGMSIDQLTDITNMGRFLPQVFENAYDKLTILIQQLKEISDRTLQAAVGTTVKLLFPAPSSGKFIRWRSDLLGLENADGGTNSMILQGLLADAGDPTHGSYMIGHRLAATGSVGRTVKDKLSEWISVKDFGATGDGVTNDTIALQAAINAAILLKLELRLLSGTYRHTGLTVNGAITISGEGKDNTALVCTNLTGTHIAVDTQLPLHISGISFSSTGVVTAGACISLTSSAVGTANQHSIIKECTFTDQFNSIQTTSCYLFSFERCTFNGYRNSAIVVQNTFNGDAGDSVITNCIFAGAVGTGSVGIQHLSSGGLRVTNNKFVRGSYGYWMQLQHTVQTGVLIFANNSVENLSVSGIQMSRVAGGAADMHFTSVVIANNEFLATATGIPINLNDADTSWLQGVSITGNVIDAYHAGTPAYAILINGANGFDISGNTLIGNSGPVGIGIGVGATSGAIGLNSIIGFTAAISNSSPSTYVAKKVYQTISGAITCSTGYGSLWSGNITVPFPAGLFAQAPVVTATAVFGTGAISALVNNVSGSGCTVTAVANTNGASVTVNVHVAADS